MTSPVDIANRALAELGARSSIASFSEGSAEAKQASLWYDTLRKQLLRAAPWGFARKQASLSLLGSYTDTPEIYPWLYKYTYPGDMLRMRYILPQTPVRDASVVPAQSATPGTFAPSRANRFIVAQDIDPASSNQRKILLSNLQYAQAVYITDVTDPGVMEEDFIQALTSAMAAKMCLALTGNVNMRPQFIQSAMDAVTFARVNDGNESIPTTDHTPDWIAVRGNIDFNVGPGWNAIGDWFLPYVDISWGM